MADERDVVNEESTVSTTSQDMNNSQRKSRKSETPSAGYNDTDEQPTTSKRGRRKSKKLHAVQKENNKSRRSSKTNDLTSSVKIKQEIIEEDEVVSERLRSLRTRKSEGQHQNESEPGPSIKEEPPDSSSDRYNDFDDSDSDPAWTPNAKAAKPGDVPKSFSAPRRKRCNNSRGCASTSKVKKKRMTSQEYRSKKKAMKPITCIKKEVSDTEGLFSRVEKMTENEKDSFLIAKTDLYQDTPFLWKVDKKSSMLQRFDISEQNGVLLYHSSYTYAARNERSLHNYVPAKVLITSPDTVQYLGPNKAAALALRKQSLPQPPPPDAKPRKPITFDFPKSAVVRENFDHLRGDFIVFVQCLLSQNVDSSFLKEIKKYNDEYFLEPLNKLEAVLEGKKEKVGKGFRDDKIMKDAEIFPCVDTSNSFSDNRDCQLCKINLANKDLQFGGQPYDYDTLAPVESSVATEFQFHICDKCCSRITLYSRLTHHKQKLFNTCLSKINEVKTKNEKELAHEEVLKICLEDAIWLETLFQEQVQLWHEANGSS